jgi:isoleucyl-tRNA synthetase
MEMPKPNQDLIDVDLERRMDLAQRIVFLSRSLREKENIRTRQALKRILVPVLNEQQKQDIKSVEAIILEEINVKFIEFVSEETSNIISRKAKANFRTLGKKFGKQTNLVANKIKDISNDEIIELEKGNTITFQIEELNAEITFEDIEILSEEIKGWSVATENGITVALDTELTQELINEGISREFVNRIQNLRKDSGFEVTDRISIKYYVVENFKYAIESEKDYICNETLATEIIFVENNENMNELELLDDKIFITIEKINN